jgi:hypothetical protein
MAEVKFQSHANQALANITKRLNDGLAHAAITLKDRIAQSLKISNQLGIFPAEAGEPPHFGIGDLIKALYAQKTGELQWEVGVRPEGAIYARQLEFGGPINIRNKEWLTVPISKEALAHKTRNRTAREFPRPLYFKPAIIAGGGQRKDQAYLVERVGRAEIIHYVLRKSVFQPAHPFMRPAPHDPEWQRIAVAGFRGDVSLNVEATP